MQAPLSRNSVSLHRPSPSLPRTNCGRPLYVGWHPSKSMVDMGERIRPLQPFVAARPGVGRPAVFANTTEHRLRQIRGWFASSKKSLTPVRNAACDGLSLCCGTKTHESDVSWPWAWMADNTLRGIV